MGRRAAAHTAADARPVPGVPHAAQSELLVDLRRHPHLHGRVANLDRPRARHALCRVGGPRLRQHRAPDARRELGVASPLHPRRRRLDVLPRRLYPHPAWPLLRILQGAAGDFVDARCLDPLHDDRHRLHGLFARVGADELLGDHGHHQSLLVTRCGGVGNRHEAGGMDLGRVCRRRTDADAALQPALSLPVPDRRRRGAAYLGAAHSRQQQSDRNRRQEPARDDTVPPLLHDQGWLRACAVRSVLRLLRLLRAELAQSSRQLHSGQSAADAGTYRAGMVLPALLRHPARDPEQAVRRCRTDRLDRHPVLRALARYLACALDQLPPDLQMVLLGVRVDLHCARLSRLAAAGRRLSRARTHPHHLLFPVLPRGHAAGRVDREAEGPAGKHHRIGARAAGNAGRRSKARASSPRAGASGMRIHPSTGLTLAAGLLLAVTLPCGPGMTEEPQVESQSWSFEGPFGSFDNAQLQRGYHVYKQICSNCHSMQLLSYRNLGEEGGPEFSPDAAATLASAVQVTDGPNDKGEMVQRPGRPSDRFRSPFSYDAAARAANGGALPPDLSLMAKARPGGPDYIYSLLTGYRQTPAGFDLAPGMHYNIAFPGHQIAMPPPLFDGAVPYTDGTKPTVDNYTRDVSAFLMWAAEPKLEERHELGARVVIFLIAFCVIMFLAKRTVWARLHPKAAHTA